MKSIVSVAMLILTLIFVGVGMLRNRKSHPLFALSRVAVVALSAILGVYLTNRLSAFLAKLLLSFVGSRPYSAPDYVEELLEKVPSLSDALRAIVGCVLACLLFFLVFLILRGILSAVLRPILRSLIAMGRPGAEPDLLETLEEQEHEREMREKLERGEIEEYELAEEVKQKEKALKKRRKRWKKSLLHTERTSLVGTLLGAVCGLMIFVVLFAPTVGGLKLADDAISILRTQENTDETFLLVDEIADAAANNQGSEMVSVLGGKQIFDGLTTYSVGDRKVCLREEASFLSEVGRTAMSFTDETVPAGEQATALRNVGRSFRETSLIPVIVPDVCRAVSADWNVGEAFCGIRKPTFGSTAATVVEPLIDWLSASTYDTVKEDINMVLEVSAVVVEKEAISQFSEDRMSVLEDETLTFALLKPLLGNERMRGVMDAVLTLGVRMAGDRLNMLKDGEALYDAWMQDMFLATTEVPYETDDRFVADLTARYEEIFENYVLTTAPSTPEILARKALELYRAEGISDRESLRTVFEQTQLTDSVGMPVFLTANTMAEMSLRVVGSDIRLNVELTNPDYEAVTLAKALKDAAVAVREMGGFQVAVAVRKAGPILDDLAATEIVGVENAERMLTAMLQWDKVCSSLGVSKSEATEIADSIVENAQKKGYAVLMCSLGDTLEALQAASDETVPMEERVEALMENMTPESAKVLQNLAKPGVMIANGVPEENAENSAKLMASMFGNLADMGENVSEAEYQREAKAVTNVTNLAMNAGNATGNGTFGEGSATGVSANDYINQVLDSAVVSKTVRDVVYENGETPVNDPLNTGEDLNAEEEAEMLAALNERWANETDRENEEVRRSYVATAAMVNMTVVITDTGIIPASS